MRSVRLVLCLIYGIEFIRTFEFRFASANSIPILKTDGTNLNVNPDSNLISDRHSDSESDPNSKINSETNLKSSFAASFKSAYLPNEMMDSTDKFRKPKRSEFVDVSLETTNLESEGKKVVSIWKQFSNNCLTLSVQQEDLNYFQFPFAEEDKNEQVNQTRNAAEELINQKEIIISQQILLVLCFGFIILIFAISRIIMNLGKSIDNRKYLLMDYQH